MIKYCLTIVLLLSYFLGVSQEDRNYIRKGNNLYEKEDFVGAEENYLKALEKNNQSAKAEFNLGDAYYKQKKFAEAAQQFQKIAEKSTDKEMKASAYHNLGNSLLQAEKYQESVNAYKQSLKLNPNDNETRYNLAYAKKMLQQQQEQENKDKDKDKQDDKKDQDKKDEQNKDKDKNDEKKDQDNKDKSDEKKDGEKDKEQQPQPNQLSKQQAQQMLDALNNQEKKVQAKLKKKKENGQKLNIEKDW
ncbi:MAG: tetratricopeptide repeat protein [Flavobacteriales bacterium]|nr:tetratricopeptide repeat protein [Flavobacteriales bacterium]